MRGRQKYKSYLMSLVAASLFACSSSDLPSLANISATDYIPPVDGQWVAADGEIIAFDNNQQSGVFVTDSYKDTLLVQTDNTVSLCPEYVPTGEQVNFLLADIDNRSVTFRLDPEEYNITDEGICANGEYTDLITLRVTSTDSSSVKIFRNSRVDVELGDDYWVSDSGLELLFNSPGSVDNDSTANLSGCVLSSQSTQFFEGLLIGFNTLNNTGVTAATITDRDTGITLFTDMRFIHKNSIKLTDSTGQEVDLIRVEAPLELEDALRPCEL